jgi:hypothetical protein
VGGLEVDGGPSWSQSVERPRSVTDGCPRRRDGSSARLNPDDDRSNGTHGARCVMIELLSRPCRFGLSAGLLVGFVAAVLMIIPESNFRAV